MEQKRRSRTSAQDLPRARGPATIEAIVDTAEQLWGLRGVDGASLREISIASGSANKSSIGYYFGDKRGLITAILSSRIPVVEKRRQPLLALATRDNKLSDPLTLLKILYQPVFEHVDRHGLHTYASFLRAINRYPLYEGKADTLALTPSSCYVVDRLREQVSHLPQALFDARMKLINEICYRAIVESDVLDPEVAPSAVVPDQLFEDALRASVYLLLLDKHREATE